MPGPLHMWELIIEVIMDVFISCFIIFHYIFHNSSSMSTRDIGRYLTNLRTIYWDAYQAFLLHRCLDRTQYSQSFILFFCTFVACYFFCLGVYIHVGDMLPWRGGAVQSFYPSRQVS